MAASIPVTALNHISILTSNVTESISFYRDVLGFRPVERPPFDFDGAWLHNYGITIHLIYNDQARRSQTEINTRDCHIAFHTEKMAEVAKLLSEHGVRFKQKTVPGTGTPQIFLHDPDGNVIEVGHYPPTSRFL